MNYLQVERKLSSIGTKYGKEVFDNCIKGINFVTNTIVGKYKLYDDIFELSYGYVFNDLVIGLTFKKQTELSTCFYSFEKLENYLKNI